MSNRPTVTRSFGKFRINVQRIVVFRRVCIVVDHFLGHILSRQCKHITFTDFFHFFLFPLPVVKPIIKTILHITKRIRNTESRFAMLLSYSSGYFRLRRQNNGDFAFRSQLSGYTSVYAGKIMVISLSAASSPASLKASTFCTTNFMPRFSIFSFTWPRSVSVSSQ